MGQLFFDIAHLAEASRVIVGLGSRTDTYVGVAPRRTSCGRRSAVGHSCTLWADCDTAEAAARLASALPPASLVVRSGSNQGRHAYWLLAAALPIGAVEVLNRRIALALRADRRCADGARVLRAPGTKNFKYTPPASVTLAQFRPELRYEPGELTTYLPQLTAPAPVRLPPRRAGSDPLRSIPPATYVRVLLGLDVGRSRKVRCPFHDDRIPSLHVYPSAEQGWYCFGCGRGTSIYDMAAAVWNMGTRGQAFLELRERLLQVFACGRG
jgi:hypothetical protein